MKKSTKKKLYNLITTSIVALLIIILQWLNPAWFDRVEGIAYDFKLVSFSDNYPVSPANIQIVDIDEQSLKTIGRWPWPRKYLAELIDQLTAQGAVVIAFDMLFSEAQQNPVSQVEQALLKQGIHLDLNKLKSQLDDDTIFAKSITNNDVILGTLFQQDKSLQQGYMLAPAIIQPQQPLPHLLNRYKGYNASIKKLNQAAQGQGFINAVIDVDGFIRRTALLSDYKNVLYPSLALETFRVYSFAEKIIPQWHHQENISLLSGIKIGKALIATDNKAQLLIPFRPTPRAFPYTSASDLINKKITDKRFDGAVVFIGSSTVGMADLRTTPVSLAYPGVEIHAAVFSALMQPNTQVTQPEWWLGANIILLVFLAIFFYFILRILSPLAMTLFALLSISVLWGINVSLWHYQHLHLPIIAILLLPFVLSAIAISKGFYSENRQRQQVKAIFDQYVPPAHIDQLLDDPNALNMEGERKVLTVLFADIRNFTNLSENLSANKLKTLLNNYFSPITEIIFNNQGTIDKYVGDMVMAFWGAPLPDENHAEHALNSAMQMLVETTKLSQQFQQQGLPNISIGIGLNTGEMNVGDMGSTFRRAYTVLGDSVNLASRLESLTKFYGVTILVSEYTKNQCSNYDFQFIDKVKVKGKQQAVTIYLPIDKHCDDKQKQVAKQFNEIFELYQQRQFINALHLLKSLQKQHGNNPLYQEYRRRLTFYITTPPDEKWDGAFIHQNK